MVGKYKADVDFIESLYILEVQLLEYELLCYSFQYYKYRNTCIKYFSFTIRLCPYHKSLRRGARVPETLVLSFSKHDSRFRTVSYSGRCWLRITDSWACCGSVSVVEWLPGHSRKVGYTASVENGLTANFWHFNDTLVCWLRARSWSPVLVWYGDDTI